MRNLLALLFLLFWITTKAQTQRGLIRTIGTSVRHGIPLSGAVIKVKGTNQQFMSDNVGAVDISLHNLNEGDKFQLLNVKKKGYELADKGFLNQTLAFSSKSLLEIVMVSTANLLREKQEIEAKILKVTQKNYNNKIRKLEKERDNGYITLEEYRNKYNVLLKRYDTFDAIISEMAEHYARTDYDRLDSLDIQINNSIINGELDRADMLVAEKGDLNDRIAAYKRHATTNANAHDMLDKITEEISKQRIIYEKEREDISNDLYNKHSISLSRFDFDNALKYMKLRADLDKTNIKATWEYAAFCHDQNYFIEAEKYYKICLNTAVFNKDIISASMVQHNLGCLYNEIGDFKESYKCYMLALANREQLFKLNPEEYREILAMTQCNIAVLLFDKKYYDLSLEFYKRALENYENILMVSPEDDQIREAIANIQDNIGLLYKDYKDLDDIKTCEIYFNLALKNKTDIFNRNQDQDKYSYSLAATQHHMGVMYYEIGDYQKSVFFYNLAIEKIELLYNKNPDKYRSMLAEIYGNLGTLFLKSEDFNKSEKYFLMCLQNYEELFQLYPDLYCEKLAIFYYRTSLLYNEMKDLKKHEIFTEKAITFYRDLFHAQPSTYKNTLIELLNDKVYILLSKELFDEALYISKEAYSMDESNDRSKSYLAFCFYHEAFEYKKLKDYNNAHHYINESINLYPSEAGYYDFKGEVYLLENKYQDALRMWNNVLIYNPNFAEEFPHGGLLLGLKKIGLIK